jgi:hypothetical protein
MFAVESSYGIRYALGISAGGQMRYITLFLACTIIDGPYAVVSMVANPAAEGVPPNTTAVVVD